jgi:RNA polymerase sigma factor (sigma-70 family)
MSAHQAEDDAVLLAGCRRGEAASWRALVERYQRLVHAIVRRIGLDEHAAADVFQTVFARLFEHLPRIQAPERLQAWIVTTAKREALLLRRRGRRTESTTRSDDEHSGPSIEDIADDALLPEHLLEQLQKIDTVRQGLDRLDERCRRLLLMLFRDDDERVPYDEVASQLGVPIGSIGPTRSRCLGKLRRLL